MAFCLWQPHSLSSRARSAPDPLGEITAFQPPNWFKEPLLVRQGEDKGREGGSEGGEEGMKGRRGRKAKGVPPNANALLLCSASPIQHPSVNSCVRWFRIGSLGSKSPPGRWSNVLHHCTNVNVPTSNCQALQRTLSVSPYDFNFESAGRMGINKMLVTTYNVYSQHQQHFRLLKLSLRFTLSNVTQRHWQVINIAAALKQQLRVVYIASCLTWAWSWHQPMFVYVFWSLLYTLTNTT